MTLDVVVGSMRFVWGDRVIVSNSHRRGPFAIARVRPTKTNELTEREREVLELVVAGHSNETIGTDLEISARTAKFHVANVVQKLGCSNRVTAAVLAVRLGLA